MTSSHPPIIIFDVDGVLLNLKGHILAMRTLLQDKSLCWNEKKLKEINVMEMFRRFDTIDDPSLRKSIGGMYRIFADLLPKRRKRLRFLIRLGIKLRKFEFLYSDFVPGVVEAIKELSNQGYLFGICSNAESKRMIKWLKRTKLDNEIHCWTTRDERKKFKIKPWPEPILATIVKIKRKYRLGKIDKSKIVYVGDIKTDIQAAKAANVKSIGVLSGHGIREELEAEQPDLILNSVAEIPNYINNLFN